MGLMKKMMEPIEKAESEFRAQQEENNHKHMEELAKIQPRPTIAELQNLMGYAAPKNAEFISAAAKIRKEKEAEEKQQADKPAEKSGYTTRETTAASKK